MTKSKTSSSASTSKNTKTSLAFQKITDSSQIQFPKQDIYYIHRPCRAGANIFEKLLAFVSLMYYKYLIHSGVYVMTKNERRIVNAIVIISIFLSTYQFVQLLRTIFDSDI